MSNLTANEIRNLFLEFFKQKGHKIVPSAPIVVKDDPTLMFTNAGMNQFKDYFLGNKPAIDKRIADTQKCLRVSGKHNDLEEVGIDTYHHTMFEMLGNWSFGDYFKKEAIAWAWELLTDVYQIPKDKLYVTVFEGYEKENLPFDQEAFDAWKALIPESRIINGSKKDNFWEMGDTGPCGPCTEIHIDLRNDEERKQIEGKTLVNNDHPQVIEIWNNVFMEFNRKADGSLEKLPAQHVDTGMGLERLVRALQGKSSNYDTDIFQPLIKKMELDFKITYGKDEKIDIALRVIADHIRAITFTIADGQLPSNNGAGYVIRRILRRAVRYGYTFLGREEPYIYQLITVLARQFKEVFPEVIKQEDFIKKVVHEEEASFLRTLAAGTKLFEKYVSTLQGKRIAATFAFELYDTFGFPFDLTQLMAREQGFEVDVEGFAIELQKQKERSRAAASKEESDWVQINPDHGPTKFLGYDLLAAEVKIIRYRKVVQKAKETFQLVFDQTPFYPEGGGQVGDKGSIICGQESILIINTFKENDLIIQVSEKLPKQLEGIWQAQVNKELRRDTANNHSATHLLHAALRMVLGTHVAQKGSLVNADALRFDFSHFAKMNAEEIRKVEMIVNEKIRENIVLHEDRSIPFNEAVSKGAMALFGEKYGDHVRMITFDPKYSIELCGGIHVPATGQIGYFKIISEGAVAAGVRRIEAVTGSGAEKYIETQLDLLNEVKETLKNPKDLVGAIDLLRENNKALQGDIEKLKAGLAQQMSEELMSKNILLANGSLSLLVENLSLESPDDGKNIIFDLKAKLENGIVLLGAGKNDKANLWLSVPEHISKKYDINAGTIIREISKAIDGGGGGQALFASAGGKKPAHLDQALAEGKRLILEKINK